MTKIAKSYYNVFFLAIPSLIAIICFELVNVVMYNFGPLVDDINKQLLWIIVQTIAGLLFAYISDQRYRKLMLIISQIMGVIGGIILLSANLKLWIIILIGITFNPLPVARAALLDNFPRISSLRIIAFTFLAQALPWILFRNLGAISFYKIIIFILMLLFLNILLTFVFFKDNYDKINLIKQRNEQGKRSRKILTIFKENPRLAYLLFAFIAAEMTFYLLLDFLEYNPQIRSWLSTTSIATFMGMCIALLYSRLPHISIVTLCYSVGAMAMLLVIFQCNFFGHNCNDVIVSAMSQYSVIGGLYLPFVTDAVIRTIGPESKALGASLIELGDATALLLAPIINIIAKNFVNANSIGIIFFFLYVIAALLQKRAEKAKVISF